MSRHLQIVPCGYDGNQCDNDCIQRIRVPRWRIFGGDYFFCRHFRDKLNTMWNTNFPFSYRALACVEMTDQTCEHVEVIAE